VVASRPGWVVVLAPTLHVGSSRSTRSAPSRSGSGWSGTCRGLRRALARAGFRHILVSNGHGGPGHLVALEEAAAIVSRRHRVTMASFTGHLAWEFLRGRLLPQIEAGLAGPLADRARGVFRGRPRWLVGDFAHAGAAARPCDDGYRTLPAARYSLRERLVPNYPLRHGGPGYVGHPAMADPAFARATTTRSSRRP